MAIVQRVCPACAAPISVADDTNQFSCLFCGSTLQVEGKGEDASLRRLDEVVDSIRESSDATQSELRRFQLNQELAAAKMQLTQIESEIRTIARGQHNAVSRRQARELEAEAATLRTQIADLERTLDPDGVAESAQAAPSRPDFTGRAYYLWLLFSWRGRVGRQGFWIGVGVVVFLVFMVSLFATPAPEPGGEGSLSPIGGLLFVLALWVGVCVSIKRLHDRNKEGWWVLVGMIPLLGPLWLLYDLGIQEGSPGPNRFG